MCVCVCVVIASSAIRHTQSFEQQKREETRSFSAYPFIQKRKRTSCFFKLKVSDAMDNAEGLLIIPLKHFLQQTHTHTHTREENVACHCLYVAIQVFSFCLSRP